MQAKHGFAVSPRGRLFGCCMALVLALSALVFAPVAGAETPEVTEYLALGDSVSFGYSQQKFEENFPNEAPAFFEGGFPNVWAKKSLSKTFPGIVVVNDSCPGETSGGLIGTEPPTCGWQKSGLTLHNGYPGHSQLESALSILNKGKPAHPIKAVTLQIGSNDELAAVHACEKEVTEEFEKTGKSKYGETPEGAVSGCVVAHAKETFEKIAKNIGIILNQIDTTGGYTGPIVVLGFYNPDAFILPGSDSLQAALNQTIEKEVIPNFPNAKYANPMGIFNPQKAVKEKAAIKKYTEMCNAHDQAVNEAKAGHALPECDGDIHPSPAGHVVLAKLIAAHYP
jgi:lysophospholipase L1-like esterase